MNELVRCHSEAEMHQALSHMSEQRMQLASAVIRDDGVWFLFFTKMPDDAKEQRA